MTKTKVAIVKGTKNPGEQEIDAQVRQAIDLAGGLKDIVKRGDAVLIKPNLCATWPLESAAVTDPFVCKVIANMVRELGAKPIIGESAAIGFDTEEVIQQDGYGKLREEGYQVIDLKKKGIETVKVPIPKGKSMKEVVLPKLVVDADVIISVPKMKTHDQTFVTLSLKNLKGLMPDTFKRKFHHVFGVFQGCADLATVAKPALTVVDGIMAMEGLGPVMGEPVEMDLVIAGKDLVAVDAVTCAVMGFEPMGDGCIRAAVESGIGTADWNKIEVVGEPIARVQRRFRSAEEAMSGLPFPEGFQLLMDEKTCTGCKLTVLEVFLDVQKQDQLGNAAGLAIVAGKLDRPPDVPKDKLLLVGACTTKYKKNGEYVAGCPPNNRDVCAGLKALGVDVFSGVARIEALEE